jgi:catechol 1,2-dioxygenase
VTHPDILGPFWASGAPFRGKVTPPMEPGELLVVRGRVWSHKTKRPLANTVLDVWQADNKGRYDFQDSPATDPRPLVGGKQPKKTDFKNRIRLLTDESGYYEFETIKPASYKAGSEIRPSHIHYMVQADGHKRLVTQIYFKGDPHIAQDPWASKSPLIIELQKEKSGKGTYMAGRFDIVLAPAGA